MEWRDGLFVVHSPGSDKCLGMGFVIEVPMHDGTKVSRLITCAHVIASYAGVEDSQKTSLILQRMLEEDIPIRFYADLSSTEWCRIDPQVWPADAGIPDEGWSWQGAHFTKQELLAKFDGLLDICVLKLVDLDEEEHDELEFPSGVCALPIANSDSLMDAEVATGQIFDVSVPIESGFFESQGRLRQYDIKELRRAVRVDNIQGGYSGAPLWDPIRHAVIGVVSEKHGDTQVASAIPTEAVGLLLPNLCMPPDREVCRYINTLSSFCDDAPFWFRKDKDATLSEIYVRPTLRRLIDNSAPDHLQVSDHRKAMDEELGVAALFCQSNALILGESGSGKTSLLKHLARAVWNAPETVGLDEPHLPIYIPCSRLATVDDREFEASVERLVREQRLTTFQRASLAHEKAFTLDNWRRRASAPVVVLLDAYDEVAKQYRRGLIKRIVNWAEERDRPEWIRHVLVTSQPVKELNNEKVKRSLYRYRVSNLDHTQSDDLIERLLNEPGMMREKADRFRAEWRRRRPGALSSNPWLLTLACEHYRFNGEIPDVTAELYEHFFMQAREIGGERQVGLGNGLTALRPHWDTYVASAAFSTLLASDDVETPHGDASIESRCVAIVSDAEDLPGVFWTEKRQALPISMAELITQIGSATGMFEIDENYRWMWAHSSFQEFFAARFLNMKYRPFSSTCAELVRFINDMYCEGRWNRVFAFLFGLNNSNSAEIDAVLAQTIRNRGKISKPDMGYILHYAKEGVALKTGIVDELANWTKESLFRYRDLNEKGSGCEAEVSVSGGHGVNIGVCGELSHLGFARQILLDFVFDTAHPRHRQSEDMIQAAIETLVHAVGASEVAASLIARLNPDNESRNRPVNLAMLGGAAGRASHNDTYLLDIGDMPVDLRSPMHAARKEQDQPIVGTLGSQQQGAAETRLQELISFANTTLEDFEAWTRFMSWLEIEYQKIDTQEGRLLAFLRDERYDR